VRGQLDGDGPSDPSAAARNDSNFLFNHDSLSKACFAHPNTLIGQSSPIFYHAGGKYAALPN
jgi:hypothetical protein